MKLWKVFKFWTIITFTKTKNNKVARIDIFMAHYGYFYVKVAQQTAAGAIVSIHGTGIFPFSETLAVIFYLSTIATARTGDPEPSWIFKGSPIK